MSIFGLPSAPVPLAQANCCCTRTNAVEFALSLWPRKNSVGADDPHRIKPFPILRGGTLPGLDCRQGPMLLMFTKNSSGGPYPSGCLDMPVKHRRFIGGVGTELSRECGAGEQSRWLDELCHRRSCARQIGNGHGGADS